MSDVDDQAWCMRCQEVVVVGPRGCTQCTTGRDPIAELAMLLSEVGAVVTFDPEANATHPCWTCHVPGPHGLFVCGVQPGNGQPKRRPFCASCRPDTPSTPHSDPTQDKNGRTREQEDT